MQRSPDRHARAVVPVVDGTKIRIAREVRGWSQAELARRIDIVTATAISQFESEAARPSARTLLAIAQAVAFPVEYFARDTYNSGVAEVSGYFRSLRATPAATRKQARARAALIRHLALTLERHVLLPALGYPRIATGPDTPMSEVEQSAREVRQQWQLGPGPIGEAVRSIERRGVIVARLPADSHGLDAFSVPFPERPVVILSADKEDRARSRFDAAHELGHLVMHDADAWGERWVEAQAHRFAASFLMPAEDIEAELPRRLDWSELARLKIRWAVSLAALVRRSKDLGVIGESTFVQAMKYMSARGWRRREPVNLGPPEAPALLASAVDLLAGQGISLADVAAEAALPIDQVQEFVGASSDQRPSLAL